MAASKEFEQSYNFLTPLCDMKDRLSRGCAWFEESSARNIILCVMKCNQNRACVGASLDEGMNCYLHLQCPTLDGNCTEWNSNHKYMAKNCANNGTWLASQGRCECRSGMIGTQCLDYPKRCYDLVEQGYSLGKEYDVKLDVLGDGRYFAHVKCLIYSDDANNNNIAATLVMTNRFILEHHFNRTWEDYRNGFVSSEKRLVWMGLENLHLLTTLFNFTHMKISLNFRVGEVLLHKYFNFRVTSEDTGYRFTYSTSRAEGAGEIFSRTDDTQLKNCLGKVKNIPFSTWDRDNDGDSANCALTRGSGWWLNGCASRCNLLGLYPTMAFQPHSDQTFTAFGVSMHTLVQYVGRFHSTTIVLDEIRPK